VLHNLHSSLNHSYRKRTTTTYRWHASDPLVEGWVKQQRTQQVDREDANVKLT